jgi:hypothetical protein
MILGEQNTFTMSQDAAVVVGRFFRSAWTRLPRFIGGGGPVPAGGAPASTAPRHPERGRRPASLRRAPAADPSRKRRSRRVPDFRTRFAARRSRGEMVNTEQEIYRAGTPQDVTSIRAKSQRHRKSTADRWNQ